MTAPVAWACEQCGKRIGVATHVRRDRTAEAADGSGGAAAAPELAWHANCISDREIERVVDDARRREIREVRQRARTFYDEQRARAAAAAARPRDERQARRQQQRGPDREQDERAAGGDDDDE